MIVRLVICVHMYINARIWARMANGKREFRFATDNRMANHSYEFCNFTLTRSIWAVSGKLVVCNHVRYLEHGKQAQVKANSTHLQRALLIVNRGVVKVYVSVCTYVCVYVPLEPLLWVRFSVGRVGCARAQPTMSHVSELVTIVVVVMFDSKSPVCMLIVVSDKRALWARAFFVEFLFRLDGDHFIANV